MSAATDGFSAMTSFFPIRERPEMISANGQAVQPGFARLREENAHARARACARKSVGVLVSFCRETHHFFESALPFRKKGLHIQRSQLRAPARPRDVRQFRDRN